MRNIWLGTVALVACAPEPDPGIQITDEGTQPTSGCDYDSRRIGLDEPAIDGRSVNDMIGDFPVEVQVDPVWFDGAPRSLTVSLEVMADDEVTHFIVTPVTSDCAELDTIVVPMALVVASDDGAIDEVLSYDERLPTDRIGTHESIGGAALQGTLDLQAAFVDQSGPGSYDTVLDVEVAFDTEGTLRGSLLGLGREAGTAGTGGSTSTGGDAWSLELDVARW
ncbi:MAG: hypothetical protein KTR31_10905 [Myxococcales bacterium]|nr:hypothetical protein [Myxococcales bacterium]